jgi:hypothetical protein
MRSVLSEALCNFSSGLLRYLGCFWYSAHQETGQPDQIIIVGNSVVRNSLLLNGFFPLDATYFIIGAVENTLLK